MKLSQRGFEPKPPNSFAFRNITRRWRITGILKVYVATSYGIKREKLVEGDYRSLT